MRDLIILRGLPGSGKSTLALTLAEDKWPVLSIDAFFTNPQTGEYKFRFEDNHLAYKNCEAQTEKFMIQNTSRIFLDNTFTLDWEIEPYFALAKKYNYRIFVATVENHHQSENIHGISGEQVRKMAAKYKVRLF